MGSASAAAGEAGSEAPAPPAVAQPVEGLVLRPHDAQLAAWAALAIINAVFIARLSGARNVALRASHHFYDAGQLIGAGLIVAGAVAAWQRWGPKRAVWSYLAVMVVAVVIGWLTLAEDVSGPAGRLGGGVWTALLAAAVALGIPAAALAGRVLALRPWLRPIGVAAAITVAVTNHRILLNDYPGAHLYLAWAAATLGGASMAGARLAKTPSSLRRRQVGWGVRAALAAVAAYALLVWPRPSVVVQLGRVQGAVLMPLLARQHHRAVLHTLAIPADAQEWFADRSRAPDVPASTPPLVPTNAIIILVTIDGMRADVLDHPKDLRELPVFTELMERSVRFTQVRSAGSTTRNSLGSLFTGKYLAQLRWRTDARRGDHLADDRSPRFTDLLVKAGVPTFTAVSYPGLTNAYGITSGFTEQRNGAHVAKQRFPLAKALVDQAVARLERHGDGPLFMFMHFMDPHEPYDAAGVKATPYEGYLAEIALCDRAIGRLLETLKRRSLMDRAVLIVSADHGEALGQHETPFHGRTLYEELLRVPLLLRVPGVPARRVDASVAFLDLGPTILDLMRLPTPGSYMGQSLTPFLRGQDPVLLRPIVADTGYMRSMVVGHIKVIQNDRKGSEELYDLSRDPGETQNLYDSMGAEADQRLALLLRFLEVHRIKDAKRGRGRR